MARPPTFAHDRNQKQQQQQRHQRQHIGICEPPLGLVKDKNHPSEQTDQLDLSLVLFPEPPSPYPATLSTYAKMGPSTVAHFMGISLGSMYNACFANFYELANGQEEFKSIMAQTLVVPARYSQPAGNAYFLMSRRRQNIFQWPH